MQTQKKKYGYHAKDRFSVSVDKFYLGISLVLISCICNGCEDIDLVLI